MKYIYNPIETGAPIGDPKSKDPKKAWVYNFIGYHHDIGQILQYDDKVAEEIMLTYEFLQDLSRTEVEKKLAEAKKPFPCEYCDKSFPAAIALSGHMRTHENEIKEKESPIDPTLVPPAEGQPTNIFNAPQVPQMQKVANPSYADAALTDGGLDDNLLDFGSHEGK